MSSPEYRYTVLAMFEKNPEAFLAPEIYRSPITAYAEVVDMITHEGAAQVTVYRYDVNSTAPRQFMHPISRHSQTNPNLGPVQLEEELEL
jgi:hypothetical protein